MPYVYSTITAPTKYGKYKPSPEKAASAELMRTVLIHGGANVAPLRDNKSSAILMTPNAVVTKVSQEELEFLESCEAFQRHKARGFLVVENKEAKSVDTIVEAGMNRRDGSAPLTPKSKEVLGTAVAVVNPES